jgi:hypothetical protein
MDRVLGSDRCWTGPIRKPESKINAQGRFGSSNNERSYFLKVAKAFCRFLPILFGDLNDLVARRTRSIETIQASMRCPFHGFQSVQFFNLGNHRFDLPDRPRKYYKQNHPTISAVAALLRQSYVGQGL